MLFELLAGPAIILDSPSPLPPPEYRNGTSATIYFVDNPSLVKGCEVPPGWVARGCTFISKRTIYMPNPCLYPNDYYARVLCHEMGHVNGWTHPSAGKEFNEYVKRMGPILKDEDLFPTSP